MNNNVITKFGYQILKSELSNVKLKELKKELTVAPIVNVTAPHSSEEEDLSFEVFREDEKYIRIPRFYGIEKFGPTKFDDSFNLEREKVNLEFRGKLRDNQVPIVEKAIDTLKNIGGGILSLPCGYGKTLIGLYIASVLQVKTLIIVHKTFLLNQWYDRIKQFLPEAKIGIIRQKKKDVKGKDIVIGMLQSISMIDYEQDIFKDFQYILYDECHHATSKVFSNAQFKVNGRYILGLSATPNRKDGLTKVLKWFLGDIIIKVQRPGDPKVLVKFFNYECDDKKLFVEKKRMFKGKINPDTVKMLGNLCKIEKRNKFIVELINNLRKQDERKILVLSWRIEHLQNLKKMVDIEIQKDVDAGICDQDEYKTAFYIGKMKEYELADAQEADIIFGSYAMAEEGLDIDGLNTLIFATPKKDIIQSIGRIMRKPIEEGDINPLIVDIIDQFSVFKTWGNAREKYYLGKKYSCNTYEAVNNSCVSIKDWLTFKNIVNKNGENINYIKEYLSEKYDPLLYDIELEEGIDVTKYDYNPNLHIVFNNIDVEYD